MGVVVREDRDSVSHHGTRRRRLQSRRTMMAACCLSLFVALSTAPNAAHADPAAKPAAPPVKAPRVAAIVTAYYRNSHADVIVSRLMQSMTLDEKGERSKLQLVSLYVDLPKGSEFGLKIAREHHVPIYDKVADALTLGGETLAVDGVLLVAEHGAYPRSATGQIIYPKRRLFTQILDVFDRSHRVVPVFSDKHLADNWKDAKWIYDSARSRHIPLMAGSSLPTLWRFPAIDVRHGEHIAEMVATSYGALDAYGFHSLEMVQCLAERRAGGETGVRSVQTLTGKAVWEAGKHGVFSRDLLDAAVARRHNTPLKPGEHLEEVLIDPVLFIVNYRDGLRACVLQPANRFNEWAVAWHDTGNDKTESTLFWTQEGRPYMHFSYLVKDIEELILTGKSPRPVERTLMTAGLLDALLISKKDGGRVVETPYLNIRYESERDWKQPPPPPIGPQEPAAK